MTKLWPYEVGAKTRDLLQCRDVENQRHDVAESGKIEHPDVTTLPNDVATFGASFGSISAHFEPRIEGFKAQTPRKQKGSRLGLKKMGLCLHFGD